MAWVSTLPLLAFYSQHVAAQTQPTPFHKYYFVGCYNDTIFARILQDVFFEDDGVDNGACHQACKGYLYFGTEFGNQ